MEQLAICIWNFKGGTGKTTISMVISQMAAQKGLNVITADLDPSHNLKRALALSSEMFPTLQVIDEVPKVNDFPGANLFVLDTHPDMSDLVKAALSFADLALIPVLGDFFSALNMGPVWRFIKDTGMSLGQAAIVKNAYENTEATREIDKTLVDMGYPVAGRLPRNNHIPRNIASGRSWNSGMSLKQQAPFQVLYDRIMTAHKKVLQGNFDTPWR